MEEPAPLLTKAAASNEGRRGRRGWGKGRHPGAPIPAETTPPRSERGGERPRGRGGGSTPR